MAVGAFDGLRRDIPAFSRIVGRNRRRRAGSRVTENILKTGFHRQAQLRAK